MTDGQLSSAVAAANSEDGTDSTGDVRNVTFIHGDDEDEDDVHENGDVAAAVEEEEEADRVPELPTDVDVEELSPPLTPDGGWGWMVVAATFVSNLIVDGVAYTFGIIMPELIDYFNSGKGKTALVGSLVSGVYLIVGNCCFKNCSYFALLKQITRSLLRSELKVSASGKLYFSTFSGAFTPLMLPGKSFYTQQINKTVICIAHRRLKRLP